MRTLVNSSLIWRGDLSQSIRNFTRSLRAELRGEAVRHQHADEPPQQRTPDRCDFPGSARAATTRGTPAQGVEVNPDHPFVERSADTVADRVVEAKADVADGASQLQVSKIAAPRSFPMSRAFATA